MSLTYTTIASTDTGFWAAVYSFIGSKERAYNNPSLDYMPRDIGDHVVTIGAGLNLSPGARKTNKWCVYKALGIQVDPASGEALSATGTVAQQGVEKAYIDRLDAILNKKPKIKGVSIAFNFKQPCHVAHALNKIKGVSIAFNFKQPCHVAHALN